MQFLQEEHTLRSYTVPLPSITKLHTCECSQKWQHQCFDPLTRKIKSRNRKETPIKFQIFMFEVLDYDLDKYLITGEEESYSAYH